MCKKSVPLGVLLLAASLLAGPLMAGPAPEESTLVQATGAPLTLQEAVAAVVGFNPGLAASRREIDIRAAEARQAGLLPNPRIS